MNLGEFRAEMLAFARMRGSQYIDDSNTSALNALISRSLREFSHESLSIFSTSVALTLTPGQSEYDLEGSAFARPVARVFSVLIDGNVLRGPTSVREMEDGHPGWRLHPSSRPSSWFAIPPRTLFLHPAPASAYSASVSGWLLHRTVSSDTDPIELSSLSLRAAVKWCAARLLEPYSSPEETPFVKDLMNEARMESRALAERNLSMITGGAKRGARREVFSIG